MRTLLASVLVVGLAAGAIDAADAADTYTLKLYKNKKGDKTEHEKSDTTKISVVLDIEGMGKKEDMTRGKKEVYTEEILERKAGDKQATKLTRTYTVAEKTAGDETTKATYAGQTVLIEKKGDKYEFSIKGKTLEESEAPDLFKQFNDTKDDEPETEDFLPDDPVKVGGSWTVSAGKSEKMFNSLGDDKVKIDATKSTIEGKLLKVYERGGARCGVIEFTITVFVTEIDLGGQFAKTAADSKIVLKGTLDTCIDGTAAFEDAKMEMTIDVTAAIPDGGSVTVQGRTTGRAKASTSQK